MEDLDILVEVLEEDLSNSHSQLELRVPQSHWDHAHPRFQPHWWETENNQQPDGNHSGNSWDSTKFHQPCSLPDSGVFWHGWSKHLDGFDDRVMKLHLDPFTVQPHSHVEARQHVQGHNPFPKSMGTFQGFAEGFGHHCRNLPEDIELDPLENDSTALQGGGQLKPNCGALAGQDTSNISLFHFQLYQEESRLRRIPQERLFESDTNGSSLLHKAVAQGKRALACALAWRLALQDRIDQEDARRQTALHVAAQRNYHLIVSDLVSLGANANKRDESGKTPLHLCAERGYPRVLEVLKNCQRAGTRLEVDATDNKGLTPLQSAAVAHSAIVVNLEKSSLGPEVWTLLTLRKDQLQCGMACLLEMGADPGGQETKSPSQSSNYAAKVQENSKLMSFLDVQRPQWQECYIMKLLATRNLT
uniref:Uncharacterized protein n=1 Tax=Sphaerodactylus townsendi TaxID=933632 RepID=A0ACB8EXT7_9SAUR